MGLILGILGIVVVIGAIGLALMLFTLYAALCIALLIWTLLTYLLIAVGVPSPWAGVLALLAIGALAAIQSAGEKKNE